MFFWNVETKKKCKYYIENAVHLKGITSGGVLWNGMLITLCEDGLIRLFKIPDLED